VRVFGVLTTLMAMSLILHSLMVHPVAWVLIRAMAGFSIAGAYMIIESWLNESGQQRKSRHAVFGLHDHLYGGGYGRSVHRAAWETRWEQAMFMVCALIYSMAVMPTALSSGASAAAAHPSEVRCARALPALTGSRDRYACCAGLIASAWGGLGPVYATQLGSSRDRRRFHAGNRR
jgi:hypothetical protein